MTIKARPGALLYPCRVHLSKNPAESVSWKFPTLQILSVCPAFSKNSVNSSHMILLNSDDFSVIFHPLSPILLLGYKSPLVLIGVGVGSEPHWLSLPGMNSACLSWIIFSLTLPCLGLNKQPSLGQSGRKGMFWRWLQYFNLVSNNPTSFINI